MTGCSSTTRRIRRRRSDDRDDDRRHEEALTGGSAADVAGEDSPQADGSILPGEWDSVPAAARHRGGRDDTSIVVLRWQFNETPGSIVCTTTLENDYDGSLLDTTLGPHFTTCSRTARSPKVATSAGALEFDGVDDVATLHRRRRLRHRRDGDLELLGHMDDTTRRNTFVQSDSTFHGSGMEFEYRPNGAGRSTPTSTRPIRRRTTRSILPERSDQQPTVTSGSWYVIQYLGLQRRLRPGSPHLPVRVRREHPDAERGRGRVPGRVREQRTGRVGHAALDTVNALFELGQNRAEDRPFDGKMDDVAFFNTVLSDTELQAIRGSSVGDAQGTYANLQDVSQGARSSRTAIDGQRRRDDGRGRRRRDRHHPLCRPGDRGGRDRRRRRESAGARPGPARDGRDAELRRVRRRPGHDPHRQPGRHERRRHDRQVAGDDLVLDQPGRGDRQQHEHRRDVDLLLEDSGEQFEIGIYWKNDGGDAFSNADLYGHLYFSPNENGSTTRRTSSSAAARSRRASGRTSRSRTTSMPPAAPRPTSTSTARMTAPSSTTSPPSGLRSPVRPATSFLAATLRRRRRTSRTRGSWRTSRSSARPSRRIRSRTCISTGAPGEADASGAKVQFAWDDSNLYALIQSYPAGPDQANGDFAGIVIDLYDSDGNLLLTLDENSPYVTAVPGTTGDVAYEVAVLLSALAGFDPAAGDTLEYRIRTVDADTGTFGFDSAQSSLGYETVPADGTTPSPGRPSARSRSNSSRPSPCSASAAGWTTAASPTSA